MEQMQLYHYFGSSYEEFSEIQHFNRLRDLRKNYNRFMLISSNNKVIHNATYLPMRMSNVRTVPSTLPAIISLFVKQTDITLSANVSIICKPTCTNYNKLLPGEVLG